MIDCVRSKDEEDSDRRGKIRITIESDDENFEHGEEEEEEEDDHTEMDGTLFKYN